VVLLLVVAADAVVVAFATAPALAEAAVSMVDLAAVTVSTAPPRLPLPRIATAAEATAVAFLSAAEVAVAAVALVALRRAPSPLWPAPYTTVTSPSQP